MNPKIEKRVPGKIRRYLKWALLSAASGLLAGTSATIFLIALNWVIQIREYTPVLIWALPLAGFLIGWLYHRWGKDVACGNNLILDEIHDPKKIIPVQMAPLVLAGTLLTHLFGGSAGREGTAVQMAASLSDQLSRFFKIEINERKILLMAGTSAGFGAAIGAPWAGVIFGMEVINVGRLTLFAWFECFIASFVGYYTAVVLGAPHSVFSKVDVGGFDLKTFFWVGIAGVCFGITARVFVLFTHAIERMTSRLITYAPLRPFLGGLVIIILFYIEGTYRYAGLGVPYINEAFTTTASFLDPIYKTIFTALTVGSGFKGGEFVPLVFIGATLGSALAVLIPVSLGILSAVGFAAVFGGSANTPIACAVMAMEIFGWQIGPYALVACLMSYYFSGKAGIYRSQKP